MKYFRIKNKAREIHITKYRVIFQQQKKRIELTLVSLTLKKRKKEEKLHNILKLFNLN